MGETKVNLFIPIIFLFMGLVAGFIIQNNHECDVKDQIIKELSGIKSHNNSQNCNENKTVHMTTQEYYSQNSTVYITKQEGYFEDICEPSREYELDVYDCTEMSQECVRRLNDAGWRRAKTKIVTVDCDYFEPCEQTKGNHMIVEIATDIYFEATTGQVIRPDQYKIYGLR